MDHRGLQRALFRMQLDPAFAERLRAGGADAEASTALGAAELACLRAADPAAVVADRDGKRAAQFARNVSGEHRLSAHVAPPERGGEDWSQAFARSSFFHEAVAEDRSLPLAFAAYAESAAAAYPGTIFAAFVALESAMVRARRTERAVEGPSPGCVVLAGTAWLVELPAGTHANASALRAAIEAGGPIPALATPGGGIETLLLAAGPPRPGSEVRELRVEPLPEPVAAFLALARSPMDGTDLARFAEAQRLDPSDVEEVAREYVGEGVLRAG